MKHRIYFESRYDSHILAKSGKWVTNNLLITGSHAFPDPDNIDADTPAHTLPWKSGDRIDKKTPIKRGEPTQRALSKAVEMSTRPYCDWCVMWLPFIMTIYDREGEKSNK